MMYSPESVTRARRVGEALALLGVMFLCSWQGVA